MEQRQQQDLPSITLQILAGPRKGETLQFQSESIIKIGRVIRGNTLPIKEPGISTKHLSIQFESGNWILTDLDSSNGTVLDNNRIPPNTPFHLHDGSTIKIGEVTSIVVNFVKPQNNPTCTEVEDKPMRGRRGNNNNKGVKVRVPVHSIDENAILSDVDDDSEYVDRPEITRVTRNKRSKWSGVVVSDSADGNLDVVEEKVEELKNVRVTRNSKNKKNAIGNFKAPEEKVEELKNVRVTRNLKNKLNKMGISESGIRDSDAVNEKAEENAEGPRNGRVTRNTKNKRVVIEENSSLVDGLENVVKKKMKGGAKGKKKLQEECVGDGDGKVNCDDGREKENLNGDDNWPDLNKMTLGEWFDFMEVYLPKKINDETEAIIDSMRQKAERLHEYVIMYQNQKA
ncbi:FHA domain-containing protein At4g14490-like [Trifolium pratense]|uniref:FHA domain-containing protein At4g14490-like n=1 Tax=Trifolium pratense TaxID=57577 RepID=UPI001E69560E|nr:FHA domain-containing protein At4g14490-like [Trifolium pratense]